MVAVGLVLDALESAAKECFELSLEVEVGLADNNSCDGVRGSPLVKKRAKDGINPLLSFGFDELQHIIQPGPYQSRWHVVSMWGKHVHAFCTCHGNGMYMLSMHIEYKQ